MEPDTEILEHFESPLMNLSLANMNATRDYSDHNSTNYSNESQTIIFSVTLITFCTGVPLNGIVIWLLGFQIKRNPFTVLILNLAISDFGFLIFAALYSMGNFIAAQSFRNLAIFYLFDATYINGLFHLTVISIDRCGCSLPNVVSLFPAKAFVSCCVPFSGSSLSSLCSWDFDLTVTAVLCLPLSTTSTLILFIKICLKSQQVKRGNLLVTILITLLCFLILTLPLYIYLFSILFHGTNDTSHNFQSFLYFILCACLNSSVNPVIYFLVGRKKQAQSRRVSRPFFKEPSKKMKCLKPDRSLQTVSSHL
uniref:G-protein coupled receptors family 1 profile domain-containing protein n=1 Tax=Naja naja TaxID=35670 RepID=A0A8C7E737_NAJNA